MAQPTKITKHDESIVDLLIIGFVMFTVLTFVILLGIF
jgi:hypothetical protein